eukprot:IDg12453t1
MGTCDLMEAIWPHALFPQLGLSAMVENFSEALELLPSLGETACCLSAQGLEKRAGEYAGFRLSRSFCGATHSAFCLLRPQLIVVLLLAWPSCVRVDGVLRRPCVPLPVVRRVERHSRRASYSPFTPNETL